MSGGLSRAFGAFRNIFSRNVAPNQGPTPPDLRHLLSRPKSASERNKRRLSARASLRVLRNHRKQNELMVRFGPLTCEAIWNRIMKDLPDEVHPVTHDKGCDPAQHGKVAYLWAGGDSKYLTEIRAGDHVKFPANRPPIIVAWHRTWADAV